jgi:GNAT acetyltransferase-like protein
MISFERLEMNDVNWEEVSEIGEMNIFQSLPWLNLLSTVHGIEPVILSVKSNDQICGYFFGLIVKKFGLRILGSPFRGWATYFMGFNLKPNVSRNEVLQAFPPFVFNCLKCHYLEIMDPCWDDDAKINLQYKVDHLPWFALDLVPNEDTIFARMKDTGRRGIRKAMKSGVTVEEASDLDFAKDYFDQYQEVMSNKSLQTPYGLERIQQLIENVYPTGSLLLLRARNPEKQCIATGIFLSLNKTAIYWGGASWKQYQSLHPNELIMWQAIKTVKSRGAQKLHLGGEAEQFKLKFGSTDAQIFRLRKANNILLDHMLHLASLSTNPRYRNLILRKI